MCTCVQKIVLIIDLRFFFHSKFIIPCSYRAPLSHLTSCTPTKSNSHLADSLTTAVGETALQRLFTFQVPNIMSLFHCLGRTKVSVQVRGTSLCFITKPVYGEELSTPRLTPKLEDHPLSAVCDCLFNTFEGTLHNGGRFSIRNPRTRQAVVTGTPLIMESHPY